MMIQELTKPENVIVVPNPVIERPKVFMEYRKGDKQIFARDLTDLNNEPALYTKSKRGLDKAWVALEFMSNHLTGFSLHDVMDTLREHGIKYHYWCMVD